MSLSIRKSPRSYKSPISYKSPRSFESPRSFKSPKRCTVSNHKDEHKYKELIKQINKIHRKYKNKKIKEYDYIFDMIHINDMMYKEIKSKNNNNKEDVVKITKMYVSLLQYIEKSNIEEKDRNVFIDYITLLSNIYISCINQLQQSNSNINFRNKAHNMWASITKNPHKNYTWNKRYTKKNKHINETVDEHLKRIKPIQNTNLHSMMNRVLRA